MSVQGEDIIFRFGSSQTTVTMDSSDNHSNAHNNDEEGSHHPDENDNNDMDDLNPLPVDITFDNDDAPADAVPGVLDGTTTNTASVDTRFNNQQGTNQSVASNNSNGVNDQSTNQSVTSNHSNSVPMMMGVPVPGGSIGGGSYPAYPADNGDVDAWAAHMQRLLMAKDNEIRFLRQELASANQQLHILCSPPTSRNNIANVSIPGTVPVSVTTNGSMNGTYNNNTAPGELDPITPRTQNPRQSSSSGNNRRSKKPKEERVKIENEIISDPYGDQGAYTGMILKATRMPHGTGHMKYKGDNRVYDGQWRYGRWHGFGKAYFANGDTYVGDYNMDQRHGYGKYQWKDGRAYDGQFHEDSRHGEGIFAWPDGSAYEGEFVNGQREGQGIYAYSDGNRYSGGWKGGKFEGYGALSRSDGSCHCGSWRTGLQHGKGIETAPDGTVRHDGEWADGEPSFQPSCEPAREKKKGPSKRSSENSAGPTSSRRRVSTKSRGKVLPPRPQT